MAIRLQKPILFCTESDDNEWVRCRAAGGHKKVICCQPIFVVQADPETVSVLQASLRWPEIGQCFFSCSSFHSFLFFPFSGGYGWGFLCFIVVVTRGSFCCPSWSRNCFCSSGFTPMARDWSVFLFFFFFHSFFFYFLGWVSLFHFSGDPWVILETERWWKKIKVN